METGRHALGLEINTLELKINALGLKNQLRKGKIIIIDRDNQISQANTWNNLEIISQFNYMGQGLAVTVSLSDISRNLGIVKCEMRGVYKIRMIEESVKHKICG